MKFCVFKLFVLFVCVVVNVVQAHWGPSASFDCEMRKLAYGTF
jgi:hypothetical protein